MSAREPIASIRPQQNKTEKVVTVDRNTCDVELSRGRVGFEVPPVEVMPVEEAEQEVGELHAEEEQEVQPVARLPSYTPTRSEYLDHCVTHNPYRPRCQHCVRGRGAEFGHFKRRGNDPNRVSLIAFDYTGLSDKGEVVGLEFDPEDESATKVLVVSLRCVDDKQRCVFGHVAPQKGIDVKKFAIDRLVGDILWTGYTSVMLKSDNENLRRQS